MSASSRSDRIAVTAPEERLGVSLLRCGLSLLLVISLVAALLALTGCGRPPPPRSVSSATSPDAITAMRIGVFPLVRSSGAGGTNSGAHAQEAIDQALIGALRTLGHHEVVAVSATTANHLIAPAPRELAVLEVADLLRTRDRLQVDAVLIGRIDQLRAFDPVAIGLTVHLVSLADGAVLWSATAQLDAGRADVQADLEWWHEHEAGLGNPSIGGWRQSLSSPALFARYVADRVMETMTPRKP